MDLASHSVLSLEGNSLQAPLGKGLKPCRLDVKVALGLSHLFSDVPEDPAVSSLGDTWGPPFCHPPQTPLSVLALLLPPQ